MLIKPQRGHCASLLGLLDRLRQIGAPQGPYISRNTRKLRTFVCSTRSSMFHHNRGGELVVAYKPSSFLFLVLVKGNHATARARECRLNNLYRNRPKAQPNCTFWKRLMSSSLYGEPVVDC